MFQVLSIDRISRQKGKKRHVSKNTRTPMRHADDLNRAFDNRYYNSLDKQRNSFNSVMEDNLPLKKINKNLAVRDGRKCK